jgi:non-specific serine/threonine protein kinase/serine/threonine-protein kinase
MAEQESPSVAGTDRSRRIAELVKSALEREPLERRAFVDGVCASDHDLRAEVDSLLQFEQPASHFIEDGALEHAAQMMAREESFDAQQQIGDYRILSRIGSGGMGDVYLAEDTKLRRKVALKLVRTPLVTEEIAARFRQEEQILARLNHPNIAQLYGSGLALNDVPFFAMEFVEGLRIDDYCQRQNLALAARLQLFRKVCSAVHYAHQHLVIHRDLKPSNILVTADGEPKLLDFGIAKLIDPQQLPAGTPTMVGVMTPDYASPEQVRGESITTASDTYSLGVVLFELLTGQRPYRTKSGRPDEIARAIAEENTARPSTALTKAPAHSPSAIVTPKSLKGDLDNIVLMAMRKEPERRYTSVAQFSEDIRRHLDGLPVIAPKGALGYRAGKFVRRHKFGVVAASLILVTLIGGIAATLREKNRAQRRFNDVRQLANTFLFKFDDAIKDLPGSTPARALIVKSALEYLDSLAHESSGDAGLRRELASAYLKVGNVQGNPTNANLGDTAGALQSYGKALALSEAASRLAPNDGQLHRFTAVILEKIADVQGAVGDTTKAAETAKQSRAIFSELANGAAADDQAKLSLAISHIKVGDVLGNPNSPNTGDRTGAMESYRASASILEQLQASNPGDQKVRRFVGIIHERIGSLLELDQDFPAALESYRRSFAIRIPLAQENPSNFDIVRDEAIAYEKVANAELATGDVENALTHRRSSLDKFDVLARADPKNVHAQQSLAISHMHLADLLADERLHDRRNFDEAIRNYKRAEEILTALNNSGSAVAKNNRHLAQAQAGIGLVYASKASDPAAPPAARTVAWSSARPALQNSVTLWRELQNAHQLDPTDDQEIARVDAKLRECNAALDHR